jgi:hypothetical protein
MKKLDVHRGPLVERFNAARIEELAKARAAQDTLRGETRKESARSAKPGLMKTDVSLGAGRKDAIVKRAGGIKKLDRSMDVIKKTKALRPDRSGRSAI